MPDLTVDIWIIITKLLTDDLENSQIFAKKDACRIARVSSNANEAASPIIYQNPCINDWDRWWIGKVSFDQFFEGFDHVPGKVRHPKKHWLSEIKSIRTRFLTIAPHKGPVMKRLLYDDNHHDRLAEVLPKLEKLSMDLYTGEQSPSDQEPTSIDRWHLMSLPAKHICRTNYSCCNVGYGKRPSPEIMVVHNGHGEKKSEFPDAIGKNGQTLIGIYPMEHFNPHNVLFNEQAEELNNFSEFVNKQLAKSLKSFSGDIKDLHYEIYGLAGGIDSLEGEKKRPVRRMYDAIRKLKFSVEQEGGFGDSSKMSIPVDIKFYELEDQVPCIVCHQEVEIWKNSQGESDDMNDDDLEEGDWGGGFRQGSWGWSG